MTVSARPVGIEEATESAVPLVFDSPHSGRVYPDGFAPAVPVKRLVGFEDRFVEELVADAPAHGVTLLHATFPRAYIDPNRAIDDLGEDLVEAGWPEMRNPTVYSERGIGLVFRRLGDGTAIYDRRLSRDEVADRIATCWRPYHAALDQLLETAVERWGSVWHANWHSMRPVGDAHAPDPGGIRPDFVVSDSDGRSAAADFTAAARAAIEHCGYSVAVNVPFKGGYIVRRHGRPDAGRHSIQVEINRGLYMDHATFERTEKLTALRQDIAAMTRALAGFVRAQISGS